MDIQYILDPFISLYIENYINNADGEMPKLLRDPVEQSKKGSKVIRESLRMRFQIFLRYQLKWLFII